MSKERAAKPWERQPQETAKAFEAFTVYREMGEGRSLCETARRLGKRQSLVDGWSAKFHWEERCSLWDHRRKETKTQSAREEKRTGRMRRGEQRELREIHAELAAAMIAKANEALQVLDKNEISTADIARLADAAVKIGRMGREDEQKRSGGGTKTRENDPWKDAEEVDLSGLSDEELSEFERLINKLHAEQNA